MRRLKGQRKSYFSEKTKVIIMVAVIVAITGFPYLQKGLCGYFPDLMYHMLRIEAVKDALMEGVFPVRIYENFFNGYGYGSPLFYPDIFLLFPAFLRMLSIPPLVVWKIFALFLTGIATVTTWWSVKYISKDSELSMAAAFLIMLSQFYLADLCHRVGISEYLAFIFIPLLIAGIYDFFVYEGKKVYLLGIAITGLVLSHTIMTFIGVIITAIIFIRMMFVRKSKNYLFDKRRMTGLVSTALSTLLIVSFYIFPMLEQMTTDRFRYMTPWANVGDYVQPFSTFFRMTGYFSHIAYVGIGIPVLVLTVICLFLKKPKNKWAALFFVGGVILFLVQTPLVPWEKLNETMLNMIQFPYRFFPYALFFLVLGITLIVTENFQGKGRNVALLVIVASAILTGVVQNMTIKSSEESKQIDAKYLESNTGYVGAGEWLPEDISPDVVGMTAERKVLVNGVDKEWYDAGDYYHFQTEGDGECVLPLMYYKGYKAELHSEEGVITPLPVEKTAQALVKVNNTTGQAGEVRVWYGKTTVQKASALLSVITILVLLIAAAAVKCKTRREEKKSVQSKREELRRRVRERR